MDTYVVHVQVNHNTVDVRNYYMTVLCEDKSKAENIAICFFTGLGHTNVHVSYVFKMNPNTFCISSNAPRKFLPNFKKDFEKRFGYTL